MSEEKLKLSDFLAGSALASKVVAKENFKRPLAAAKSSDPIQKRRDVFKAAVNQQLEFIENDKDGVVPEVKGKKYIKTEGETRGHAVEVIKRPIRWYFKSRDEFVLTIKYGSSVLFEDGFKCRTLDEVAEILNDFITIADSGKLDGQFASVKRPGRKPANYA